MAANIALLTAGLFLGRMTKKQKSVTIDNSTRAAQAVIPTSPDNTMQLNAPPPIEMTENAAYGIAPVKTHGQEDEAEREESSLYCEVKNMP